MAHVAQWKKETVDEILEMINENRVIGLVNVDGIPGRQMLQMRKGLRDGVSIKVTKNRLIRFALEEAEHDNPGISKLLNKLDGQCGIVATDMNPFKLYQIMKKTITPSPAKGGDKAPEDIVIKAGDTPFKPGPIVGDFGKAGIPASIDKGKVVIKKTTTPCKEGEMISKDLATMLTKLEIFPMKVGMNLNMVYEEGNLYKSRDLDIDVDQFRTDLSGAHLAAMNLAMFAAIATPFTIKSLLQKAYRQSLALAVNAAFPTRASTEILLTKAYVQMLSLASRVSQDSLDDDLKGIIVGGAAAAAAATQAADSEAPDGASSPQDQDPSEDPEEEEVSEEEAMSGLGALFG